MNADDFRNLKKEAVETYSYLYGTIDDKDLAYQTVCLAMAKKIKYRDFDKLLEYLDVEFKQNNLDSLLRLADSLGYKEFIYKLLHMGANVNTSTGGKFNSVFNRICFYDNSTSIKNMLKFNPDVNIEMDDGTIPLMMTITRGLPKVINLILKATDFQRISSEQQVQILNTAIVNRFPIDIIVKIINKLPDLKNYDFNGNDILHNAVTYYKNPLPIVEKIIEKGYVVKYSEYDNHSLIKITLAEVKDNLFNHYYPIDYLIETIEFLIKSDAYEVTGKDVALNIDISIRSASTELEKEKISKYNKVIKQIMMAI